MSVKKPLAIVATAAMVMTGASFGSAAAVAVPAGNLNHVPVDDIRSTTQETESAEYNNWHFDPSHGQEVAQGRNGLVVAGTAAAAGDVLIAKGNGNDVNPAADQTPLADVLTSLGASVSSADNVTLQVPVRVDANEDGVYTADEPWSTLRASVADPSVWTTSKALGTIGVGGTGSVGDFAGITGIYPIATGLLVQGNTEDVLVSSFTSGGTETKFYHTPGVPVAGESVESYVDASDIGPDESNYEGWHDGAEAGGTFATVEGAHGATLGLEVTGKAQILNGFGDEQFLNGGLEFANGMSIEVTPGGDAVFAQVPVFYYPDGNAERQFTTLRAEVTPAGFTPETVWTNSGTVAGIAGKSGTIADYIDAMGQHDVIGYGFFVDTGKTATVTSISFNGATTEFAKAAEPLEPAVPGEPSTEYVDAAGIRPNEEKYAGWHDGVSMTATERNYETQTRANGATTGLKVNGKSQILNGFADKDFQRNALEFANAMTISVAAGGDDVFAQIPVFYGADGKSFTTLRALVTPEGFTPETVWTNSGTVPGISGKSGTIAEYVDAMGKHDVIGYGFFVDTDKTATVTSISFNGATTEFTKAAPAMEPAYKGAKSTEYVDAAGIRPNEEKYAGWHDGVSKTETKRNFSTVAGKNGATLGLKVTGKSQILNGYADAAFQRNSLEFADEMTVSVAAGSDEVFAQLPVFFGVDGKSFTTLRAQVPASGKLSDVTEWTSSKAIAGSDIGANSAASLDAIIEAMGNHKVIGHGFFVDTGKTATVTSISFNGATTNFTKAADPVKPEPAPFTDITATSKFSKEINWMWNAKISTGNKLSNGTYVYLPKDNVSREAMAAFLFRLYGDANYQAPAKSPFTDLKKGDKFYKEITWMAQAKISTGNKQANGTFKYLPKDNVTREAMAAFLYRADKGATPATTTKSPFTDMKPGDKFYKEILWMWDAKVSTGNKQANGTYKYIPKDNTSREAMAAFLYRAAPDSKK